MSQKVTPDKLENLTPPCGVTELPQAERGLVSGRHRSRETTGTATPSPRGLRRALASTASDTALHLGEGRGQTRGGTAPLLSLLIPGVGTPPPAGGASRWGMEEAAQNFQGQALPLGRA